MKKVITIILLNMFVLSNFANAAPVISENDISIINRAVDKITNEERTKHYLQKLATIETRIIPDKISTYEFLIHSIEKQQKELIFKNDLKSFKNDVITDMRVIPIPYRDIASKVKKIVSINNTTDFEFRDDDGLEYSILPYLYIKLSYDPAFIRTVERTYDLTDHYLMHNKEDNEYYLSIQQVSIEKKVNLEELPYTAKQYIEFTKGIDTNGLAVAPLKIDGIDYIADTKSYSYSYLPKKPFYQSSYTELPNLNTIPFSIEREEIRIYDGGDFNFYKFPFHISKKMLKRDQMLAYLGTDILHFSESREAALQNSAIWKELTTLTNQITAWAKTEEEKINRIYTWITNNIRYDSEVYDYFVSYGWAINNLDQLGIAPIKKEVFSGLWAFKNLTAVCQGITKLAYYMLNIAWVKDVSIIDGYANNTEVYLLHSWLKIGDKYYDPTFDLGNKTHIWYGLPKDIMYTSRGFADANFYLSLNSAQLREDFLRKLESQYNIYWNAYPIFNKFLIK